MVVTIPNLDKKYQIFCLIGSKRGYTLTTIWHVKLTIFVHVVQQKNRSSVGCCHLILTYFHHVHNHVHGFGMEPRAMVQSVLVQESVDKQICCLKGIPNNSNVGFQKSLHPLGSFCLSMLVICGNLRVGSMSTSSCIFKFLVS